MIDGPRRRRRRLRRRHRDARARGCRLVLRQSYHDAPRDPREAPRRGRARLRLALAPGRSGPARCGPSATEPQAASGLAGAAGRRSAVGDGRRGGGRRGRRVACALSAAGVRHHVGGARRRTAPAARPATRASVDGDAPAREPDEADRARLQPLDEPLDARRAGAVLVGRELVGARPSPASRGRSCRRRGARSACDGIAVARHEPGRERSGPEAVARAARSPTPRVGRVQARVEAAHEEPHARADGVGQRPSPRRRVRRSTRSSAVDAHSSTVEPGADDARRRAGRARQRAKNRPGKSSSRSAVPRRRPAHRHGRPARRRRSPGAARAARAGAGRAGTWR